MVNQEPLDQARINHAPLPRLLAAQQVVRKPTELFFPVSGVLAKSPRDTWREYGAAFRHFATPAISPELLAALAQVEGSGNPLVRTN